MKVFVIGANGHTGSQVIDLALARGHEVTAFVRSPEKIKRQHPLLKVLRGDPHNVDELASALKGQDVVVSALGVRPPKAFRPHSLVVRGKYGRGHDEGGFETAGPGISGGVVPREGPAFRILPLAACAHHA